MPYLHVFDMDGTLLQGTTASLEISQLLQQEEQLMELEASFRRRDIDTRDFARGIHQLWSDLSEADVSSAFDGSPFLSDIRQVCKDIRSRGEHSLVVSMSPDFYARLLLRFGFDEVVASRFPQLPFTSPIIAENILTPEDKVSIVKEKMHQKGMTVDRCVAYGDSMSDAPLFRYLTNTVAVNGDEHIAEFSDVHYSGSSLWEAYSLARTNFLDS